MKKNKSKKITVQELARIMTDGFAQIRKENADGFARAKQDNEDLAKQANKDNEDLAVIVKGGFDEVNGRITLLERRQQETNDRLELVKREQEEIKLRLTNVAYKFELDTLEKRTQKVEDIVLRKKG